MNKTEMFFEKNSKSMIIALLALFVLAAAIFGYRQLISQPRERKAAEMIAQAQYRFESTTPEYQLALEGDANGPGFLLRFRCMTPPVTCRWTKTCLNSKKAVLRR